MVEGPSVQTCGVPLPYPADGCAVSGPTDTGLTLIQGNLLLESGSVLENGVIAWGTDGKITYVGCADTLETSSYRVIACGNTIVSPGLINPHDHITYDQETPDPAFWGNIRYDRRDEWRKGLNNKPKIPYQEDSSEAKVAWTELRQVLVGTTSIAGSGGIKGLLRNTDRACCQEGLTGGVVDYDTFPLGDTTDVAGHTNTCAYPHVVTRPVLDNLIFLPHVGEGIDAYAHNEILCLTGRGTNPTSPGVNLQAPNSSFIHSVASTFEDAVVFKNASMSAVWSPRSNLSLYGNTAPVAMFHELGVNVALSSDWTSSGSMNLQRELVCASSFNQLHMGNYFSDSELWTMVTKNAARALGFENQIGQLTQGYFADLYAITSDGYVHRAIWEKSAPDVRLVVRAGQALYGDSGVVASLRAQCDFINVCGESKQVCLQDEIGMNYQSLSEKNMTSYPLVFCNTPPTEPTCIPSRPNEYPKYSIGLDLDQDGAMNSVDNCRRIFNPARPMDNGQQPGYFCYADPATLGQP